MRNRERAQAAGRVRTALRRLERGAWAALLALAWALGGTAAAQQAAGDTARGRAMFTGAAALQAGGMPCIGCHNASDLGLFGGGTLASDLSDAGSRYGASDVIASLLKDMPFPAMQAVYGPRPLTEAETADLAAYLASQAAAPGAGTTLLFFGLGLAGMLILAGLSQILWRNRLKGVRRQLTGGR